MSAALAGGGTFGLFTDPATTSPNIGAARIDISLSTPGGPPVPFSGTGFYPGSSVSQDIALKNEGGAAIGGVRLTTSATSPNLLTTDPVNGLQLTLTYCSQRWTEGGSASAPTFTCGNNSAYTVYSGPFLTDSTLTSLGTLSSAAQLLITVSLPATADNRFQGLQASLGLAFRAQQVEGRVR
ncbi:TasA family protein [Geodermatophilus sp. SYSU D00742]